MLDKRFLTENFNIITIFFSFLNTKKKKSVFIFNLNLRLHAGWIKTVLGCGPSRFDFRPQKRWHAEIQKVSKVFIPPTHWKAACPCGGLKKAGNAWVSVSSWGDVNGVNRPGRLGKRSAACLWRLMLVCMASVQPTMNWWHFLKSKPLVHDKDQQVGGEDS